MKIFTAEYAENAESNHSKEKIQKSQIVLGYFHFNSSLRPLRSPRLIFYFLLLHKTGSDQVFP